MHIRLFLGLVLVGTLLAACSKSNLEDFDLQLGYEYFPLEVGQSRTYAVDSIIYDPAQLVNRIDTLSGFLREDIVDTLQSVSGDVIYRIERYYRRDESQNWQIHSVVTSSRDEEEAVFTENNLRFLKLRFPLKTDAEWKGTAYFPEDTEVEVAGESLEFYKDWNTKVLERRENYALEAASYSDVYLLELANFENLIEYRYGLEAYAPGKGLIYQEIWVLDTQCQYCCNGDFAACSALPWEEKAEKGLILRKRLIE
ncbi:MAG: hypothetical protein R2824_18310 [Saprospiraceae bacterium]|nr:hypothetical protein [Lewinella sp.]